MQYILDHKKKTSLTIEVFFDLEVSSEKQKLISR